jgi:hypothetical protein
MWAAEVVDQRLVEAVPSSTRGRVVRGASSSAAVMRVTRSMGSKRRSSSSAPGVVAGGCTASRTA